MSVFSRKPRGIALLVMLFSAGLAGSGALGQAGNPSQARNDGKAFAAEIATRAQDATQQTPTADSVPNFDASPSQSSLFDDPDALARAAGAAATSHEGYQAVRSSVDRRARIAPADIEATIARGQAVAADPNGYVSGMGVGGGQGSCRELPPGTGASGSYEATCNDGLALEQKTERCTIPLNVSVTSTTTHLYYCSSFNAGFNRADDCTVFEPYMGGTCRHVGSHPGRCLQGYSRNGQYYCTEPGEPIDEIACDAPVTGGTLISTSNQNRVSEARDERACAALSTDAGCVAQAETCTSSDPVTRTVNGVEVTRPCWAWEKSYQCSRAVPAQDCGSLDANPACSFARRECLSEDEPCTTWERIYRCAIPDQVGPDKQYICDGDIYCINGDCETIDRQPNAEFKDAAVALNAAAQAGREFDPDTLSLFKGTRNTCKSAVFGVLNCCKGKAFPLIPGSQLLVALGCSREEILLHQRDATGLCHYVGSYCSSSVLGVCVTKRKAYCCFESKLSRILQEQGRPQIGKPWGSPKRETCLGFTVDEFARLDLSLMDFSEVYAEFQDAVRLPEELSTVASVQQKITDFYTLNGPR
ncbi:conjugal transfer protein TraN [Sphingomonas sp. NPDC079357]|uniref:conjugal transfer protein TraN n=1 Tax=Sphingomonas sp. NPDC079357 TaxID=3364518 RepID=UPI00384DA6B7